VKTLVPVIKRLKSRFDISDVCVVSDRGMISKETMAYLEEEKISYILGARMRRSKEVQVEVLSRAGRFREDLFYRLNVLPIHLPALRERKEDIPALTDFFIDKFNRKLGREVRGVEQEVRDLFLRYPWPGNIREMENLLERMVLMSRGDTITAEDVPPEMHQALEEAERSLPDTPAHRFKEIIRSQTEEVERQMIARCLEECGGNVTHAARRLGLSRKGLQLKMIKYDLRK